MKHSTSNKLQNYNIAVLNPPLCKCGCGNPIKIKKYMRYNSIPQYIIGHWSIGKKYTVEEKQKRFSYLIGKPSPRKGKGKNSDFNINQVVYCICGCEGQIKILPQHRWAGVPTYISGHNMILSKKGVKGVFKHTEATKKLIRKNRLAQVLPLKDTSIEIKIQEALLKEGVVFEKHKNIKGQPDIFIEPNICIFADGDYWHGNPEKYTATDILCNGLVVEKSGKKIRLLPKN